MKKRQEAETGWHRADVIAAIRKKGSNLSKLARAAGLSRHSLSWALGKPHPRANRAIADFLGLPLHRLWPEWFDRRGKRLRLASRSAPGARPSIHSGASAPRQAA